jgi:hypothetical protein
MRTPTRRLLNEPLLHFLVLGAALFGLYGGAGARRDDPAAGYEVVVTAGRLRSLAKTFSHQWNRPPSEEELSTRAAESPRGDGKLAKLRRRLRT